MSVKTTAQATTVALVLVAAAGLYYFGRGSKLDTSNDRDVALHVSWELGRPSSAIIQVYLNGANHTSEGVKKSPWDDHMWLRPGEKVTLSAFTTGNGNLLCRIVDQGKNIDHSDRGENYWDELHCSVTVVG